tara:strand:+ start:6302 stop:6805 length:504 start_codon:yes stop_codon:yes gene_type:complete
MVNVGFGQELYQTTSAELEFYSEAPIEDIKAASNKGISVINLETGAIAFQVKINTFQFEKALMQEHFNENYMESEKFPKASFKGKMQNVDISSNREQVIIIKGTLTLHGVTKEVEIPANFQLNNNQIKLNTTFVVACKDHNIKIPKLLWQNIAETIQVQLNANYQKT